MQWFKHMLTGIDNHTTDIARVALLLGIFSVIGFTAFDAIHEHHAFNAVTFATAYVAVVSGICGGIWWKRDTEPKGNPELVHVANIITPLDGAKGAGDAQTTA